MTAPWPCSMWGMDVIGAIDLLASNGHRFILVAIEYFTKWVETESYKYVTKKVVTDFLRKHIICRFGVPETLITDNAKNLNNDMVDGLCEQLKIKHKNSSIYRPQINGAVEATNKNLKKIIQKLTERHRDWHEKLPYALMAYRTTIRTSGMETVLPAEVEIPSLRILMEAKLDETYWIKQRHEQLSLIDEKRLNAICHGQCYQRRVACAYNKKVTPRIFTEGDKVLKHILPVQEEAKGKFAPNWQGPFIVQRVLSGGALILAEIDGTESRFDARALGCLKLVISLVFDWLYCGDVNNVDEVITFGVWVKKHGKFYLDTSVESLVLVPDSRLVVLLA
ncbi:uncharacterized protein K02A2.6-like [Coffea eugenioides]|uniref:uncharacterized protein K02A2.6-like n=1 Tax=Coffea eugenioides TaxID=49369 RepID=UPI000F612BCA|nr:uncharacterized protein K02A2.6-like [Coffea eugenioides]